MSVHTLFVTLDILGVFVFAISGATAALQNRLDLFGVVVVAFVTACGGGLIRDLCIGAIPPAGLSNWIYLAAAIAAALTTVCAYGFVERLAYPVLHLRCCRVGIVCHYGLTQGPTVYAQHRVGDSPWHDHCGWRRRWARCVAQSSTGDLAEGDLCLCGIGRFQHRSPGGGFWLVDYLVAVGSDVDVFCTANNGPQIWLAYALVRRAARLMSLIVGVPAVKSGAIHSTSSVLSPFSLAAM